MVDRRVLSSRLGIVAFATLIFIAVLVALLRPWHSQTESDTPSIRIGYLPIYVDLPLFVAEELEYFSQRGIRVEFVRFETSPDMAAALVGGQIDGAASVATSSALAVETRDAGRFKIFLVDAETPENPLSSLMVASNSSIESVMDLSGKTIGSFPGPTAQLFAPLALQELGLEKGSYTIQELPIGSHAPALETGKIDAVVTYEPTATLLEMRYQARRLVPAPIESNVISPWQAGIWIISTDYLDDHPEQAEQFVWGIYDAVEYMREHPIEAKRALSGYVNIDADVAERTPNIPFTTVAEADVVTLQRHANLLVEHGTLSRQVDVAGLMMTILPERE